MESLRSGVRRLHQAHALLKGFAERTPEHPPKRAHRDVLVFLPQKSCHSKVRMKRTLTYFLCVYLKNV
jgi:hypothetical protein